MVQQEILINWAPQETRVAILENTQVQELHIERERGLVGNIYLGKVVRVLPGMQSAFIDIGLDKAAFLHVSDFWQSPIQSNVDTMQWSLLAIEKRIFEGQRLTVQVLKDSIGSKGARLTTQISIVGRLLVFMPQDDHIGVSQKIHREQRDALRERLTALATSGNAGVTGGFILRTNGELANDQELLEDMQYLGKTWSKIQLKAQCMPPSSLLHQELTLVQRVLRDLVDAQTRSIQIDSSQQFLALQRFAHEFMPQVFEKIQHYRAEKPIFDVFGVDKALRSALGKRVDLKSGGYLVVDQTEAMTTIDVNTGAYVGVRNFEETIYKTNLEAAVAIAGEMRLRNLGGIVIVDFIDMEQEEHQRLVLAELHQCLSLDKARTSVSAFSSLGLVEMTRKRLRGSLAQTLCQACPTCQGSGLVKSVQTVAYEILREILREAKQFNPKEFRVIAHPAVCELFLDEESAYLAELSSFVDKPIYLQADPIMTPEQYDIVLM